jgi:hypothetical protein
MAADQGDQSLSVYPNRQEISPTNTVQDLPLDVVAHNAVFLLSGVLVAWLLSSILFQLGQLRPRSRLITSSWFFRHSFSQLVYFLTMAMMRFWRNDIDCFCIYPTSACLPSNLLIVDFLNNYLGI